MTQPVNYQHSFKQSQKFIVHACATAEL